MAVRIEPFGFEQAEKQLRAAIDAMEKISRDAIHRFAELSAEVEDAGNYGKNHVLRIGQCLLIIDAP